jgi:hypothetical protein
MHKHNKRKRRRWHREAETKDPQKLKYKKEKLLRKDKFFVVQKNTEFGGTHGSNIAKV